MTRGNLPFESKRFPSSETGGGEGWFLKGSFSSRMNLLLYNSFLQKQFNKRQATLMTVMGNLTLQVHWSKCQHRWDVMSAQMSMSYSHYVHCLIRGDFPTFTTKAEPFPCEHLHNKDTSLLLTLSLADLPQVNLFSLSKSCKENGASFLGHEVTKWVTNSHEGLYQKSVQWVSKMQLV